MNALAYETWYLGNRTMRRFIRVPANVISVVFFAFVDRGFTKRMSGAVARLAFTRYASTTIPLGRIF